MGRKIEIEDNEDDNNVMEVENNKKSQQKIKREKVIQKPSNIIKDSIQQEMKQKRNRVKAIKNEKIKENKQKILGELQNPQGFTKYIEKIKEQQKQSSILKNQKKKIKVKKQITKEEQRKQAIQAKLKFKKQVDLIQTEAGILQENEKDAMKFDGFDNEFEKMQKIAELQKQQEMYENSKGTSNKQKNKIQNSEISKMKNVLNFKPFQSNPLAALKQHITNQQQQQKK